MNEKKEQDHVTLGESVCYINWKRLVVTTCEGSDIIKVSGGMLKLNTCLFCSIIIKALFQQENPTEESLLQGNPG